MRSLKACLLSVDRLPRLSIAVTLVAGTACLAAGEHLSEE
jgi:hypothetical protein